MSVIALFAALCGTADAAEVLWLEAATPEAQALVNGLASPTRAPVGLLEFRAAATAWSADDDAALAALEQSVKDARTYETKLDGELVIMSELAGPIAGVGLIRDDTDRERLFSALAYQGFAVNRFFEEDLGTDERAADYRHEIEGSFFELPWVDAVALDPTREVTPYEIAEAPQRVAFGEAQQRVGELLPAILEPGDWPENAVLFVDGRKTDIPASGTVKVSPGRHLAHLEVEGQVIARYDVRGVATQKMTLEAQGVSEADFNAFIDSLLAGAPQALPAALLPSLEVLGGEIWAAVPGEKGKVTVHKITADGVTSEEVKPESGGSGGAGGGGAAGASIGVAAGGGWFMSDDFYTQDPLGAPHNGQTVNALTTGIGIDAGVEAGPAWIGAGLDLLIPTGMAHVALTGDGTTRPRAHPHIAVGLPVAQLTAGYMFPYHGAVGAKLAIPAGPVEIQGRAQVGLAGIATRDDDSEYEFARLYTGWVAIGWRTDLGS